MSHGAAVGTRASAGGAVCAREDGRTSVVAKNNVKKKTKKFMKRMKKAVGRLREDVDKLKDRKATRVANAP